MYYKIQAIKNNKWVKTHLQLDKIRMYWNKFKKKQSSRGKIKDS